MEQLIIIILSITLISVIGLIVLYTTVEKKKKMAGETTLNELKELLKKSVQDNARQITEAVEEGALDITGKFDSLAKDVRTAQDQANQKINSGFEELQSENKAVRRDVDEKIADIKSSFKDYSEKVKVALSKYSEDNAEYKKSTEAIKDQIQKQLQNLLKEIKSPLDLD